MAQNWEIGGGVGYGAYKNASISGPGGTADAGVRNAYTVTGVANEDLFEHFSGEFRYIYHAGETFLQSGSAQGSVQARSHTVTYDILLHFKPRNNRIRPYLAGGVGAKYYETTGTVPRPQPVPAVAGLTTQSQWKPAFDFGGGVKVRVTDHVVVRGDARDGLRMAGAVGAQQLLGLLAQLLQARSGGQGCG